MKKSRKPERYESAIPDVDPTSAIVEGAGTESSALREKLFDRLLPAIRLRTGSTEDAVDELISSATALYEGIGPINEVEGMLATHMVATHHAALDCLHQAMNVNETLAGREQNLRYATKFLSIFSKQLEVLNRNRGKGQQKVTVEHVQVQSGGQAIVGNVEHAP